MTTGFMRIPGFAAISAVEWELRAAATYAANFGERHVHWGDIAEFRDVPKADVVIGGPPCQGFSNLGSRDPDDPRNRLWREYVRVVLAADPEIFVLENVERFSKSLEFELLMTELTVGKLKRWSWYQAAVLNAADFGVPQRRLRTILIASRVGQIELPRPTHSKDGVGGLPKWTTVESAISHLPRWPEHSSLPAMKSNFFDEEVPGVFKMTDLHVKRNPNARSLARYDCVPPGGGRFDLPRDLLPPCWANKPTGTTDVMGRMRWDQPSLTIRTEFFKPEKGQYLHPAWDPLDPDERVNRPITHQEAALLQTFPPEFEWCGSKLEIARWIGNAVPPRLAEALARVVADRLS